MNYKLVEKINKDLTGFSLVELIVSVSILALLTGLFLADYKSGNRQAELNAAANQLANDLRLAQSYALGAKKNEKNGNTVPAGGWGIRLRETPPNDKFYELFADSDTAGSPHTYDASDYVYKKIFFPGGGTTAFISILDTTSFDPPPNDNSIVFLPPDPVVYFDGEQAGNVVCEITLQDSRTLLTKKVIVNSFGLIDVE